MFAMWLIRILIVLAIIGVIGWVLYSIITLTTEKRETETPSSLRRKIEELETKRRQLAELSEEVDVTHALKEIDARIAQLRAQL